MAEPIVKILQAGELDLIRLKVLESETPGATAVIETMKILCGPDVWDAAEEKSLAPWDWVVPESQWRQICEWVIESSNRQSLGQSPMLTWMNNGPSARALEKEKTDV